jgi:hypothetical protein
VTAAGNMQRLKPARWQPKVTVETKSSDELETLRGSTVEANTKIMLMVVASEILEVLAQTAHSACLVAQGGLLAAARALEWDLHSDLNTACSMVVFKLASESDAYLQMVCNRTFLALPDCICASFARRLLTCTTSSKQEASHHWHVCHCLGLPPVESQSRCCRHSKQAVAKPWHS